MKTLKSQTKVGLILFAALIFVPVLFTQAEPARTDAQLEVMAKSIVSDPEAAKVAFLSARRYLHEQSLSKNAAYKNQPAVRQQLMDKQSKLAEDYVDGSDFKGTLIESGLKEGLDYAKKGLAVALKDPRIATIPRKATDQAADYILQSISRQPMDPKISVENQIAVLKYTLKSAKDPADPNREYSRKLLTRMHINPDQPFDFDPRMGRGLENKEIIDEIGSLKKDLQKLSEEKNRTQQENQELQAKAQRLLELTTQQIQKGVAEAVRTAKQSAPLTPEDQVTAKKWSDRMNDVSQGFGTAAQIAVMLGDPKLANTLNQASIVSVKVGDLIATTLTKTFSENPMAYANVYMAAALAVKNMIGSAQEQNQMAAMMKALQQISEQIENLRQEMNARFDKIDMKMDHYFDRSFVELVATKNSTGRLETLATQALTDINNLHLQMETGLKSLWQMNITDWKSQCFPATGKMSPDLIQRCRNQFALFATSQWNTVLAGGSGSQLSQLGALSNQEFQMLGNYLDQSRGPSLITHPANWLGGVQLFTRLFHDYPNYQYLAANPGPGFTSADGLTLDDLIRRGENLETGMQELALQKVGGGYRLKSENLKNLIEGYRHDADQAIDNGLDIRRQFGGTGPNPRAGLSDPIIIDDKYPFFVNKTIGFCPEIKNKAIDSKFMGKIGFPKSPAYDSFRAFDTGAFKWNSAFLPLMPRSFVWASRMGTTEITNFENIEVFPCFREISLTTTVGFQGPATLHFHIDLEFRAAVGIGQNRRVIRGGHAVLDQTHITPTFVFLRSNDVKPVPALWQGQAMTWYNGIMQSLDRHDYKFNPSVVDHPTEHFKVVPLDQPDPEFARFETALNRRFSSKSTSVDETINNYYNATQRGNSKDLLLLIGNLGISSSSAGIKEFMSYMSFDDTLPDLKSWASVAASGKVGPDELRTILDKKISMAEAKVDWLAQSTALRPQASAVSAELTKLRQLKSGKK